MLELRIISGAQVMPIFDLPAAMGRSQAAREIGDTIEGLMAFLDDLSGDPDLEDGADDELSGDELGDPSWSEWHTRGRFKQDTDGSERMRGCHGWRVGEDDEDDDADTGVEDHPLGFDPEEDKCSAGDDMVRAGPVVRHLHEQTYRRSGIAEIGSEDDAERVQPPAHGIDQTRPLTLEAAND